MDEIQIFLLLKSPQISLSFSRWQFRLKRHKAIQGKDGVIEIAPSGAILESTILILLTKQESPDQFGGIPEELRREAGDLEHFEAKAHRLTAFKKSLSGRRHFSP